MSAAGIPVATIVIDRKARGPHDRTRRRAIRIAGLVDGVERVEDTVVVPGPPILDSEEE